MTKKFIGYSRPSENEFEDLWKNAIFVFDTNVLLNLYGYPETIREVFLSVINKISSRIWVPYQVGIEFHRNKLVRIKQSNQKLLKLVDLINQTSDELNTEVESIELEKRQTGIDDIQDRLKAVKDAHVKLSEAVQAACNKLPTPSLEDGISEHIVKILNSQSGEPPSDQAALDQLISDGDDRYSKQIPPGFLDAKEKGESSFRDRGITYLRKFGDLILWKQLIAHTSSNKIKKVIFVTSDRKKDWWWMEDGKVIGPLPELVQEIHLQGNVNSFWMYTSDQFLEFAQKFLQAKEVTSETISQVKELSESDLKSTDYGNIKPIWSNYSTEMNELNYPDINVKRKLADWVYPIENTVLYSPVEGVYNWLLESYPEESIVKPKKFPDYIIKTDKGDYGYEVCIVNNPNNITNVLNNILKGYIGLKENRFKEFSVVIVFNSKNPSEWISNGAQRFTRLLERYPITSLILGSIVNEKFMPYIIHSRNKN
jgi:hypothetical protein